MQNAAKVSSEPYVFNAARYPNGSEAHKADVRGDECRKRRTLALTINTDSSVHKAVVHPSNRILDI